MQYMSHARPDSNKEEAIHMPVFLLARRYYVNNALVLFCFVSDFILDKTYIVN